MQHHSRPPPTVFPQGGFPGPQSSIVFLLLNPVSTLYPDYLHRLLDSIFDLKRIQSSAAPFRCELSLREQRARPPESPSPASATLKYLSVG